MNFFKCGTSNVTLPDSKLSSLLRNVEQTVVLALLLRAEIAHSTRWTKCQG